MIVISCIFYVKNCDILYINKKIIIYNIFKHKLRLYKWNENPIWNILKYINEIFYYSTKFIVEKFFMTTIYYNGIIFFNNR